MALYYDSLNFISMKIFEVGMHNFNYCIEVCCNSASKLLAKEKQYFFNKIKPFGRFLTFTDKVIRNCERNKNVTTNCYRSRYFKATIETHD